MTTSEHVLSIIERETGKKADESMELEDLGADSLEMMSIFTALDIPDEAIPDFQTIGDIIRYLEQR